MEYAIGTNGIADGKTTMQNVSKVCLCVYNWKMVD